ncbi:tripartite tricarboxylate transporter substrate binding protein [Verticiella sediminum]|uniref:Tripartite tricarboxylate transporter substrate binding protein n=1 Tax=Verticiella sediminum TaxID=1247510 RepID=A0A556AD02_9BURK|nr:tripartite tricarboxylate transporter substrate binding protein [Verticiella sediminum]TSH90743.1 tripartite tricarboxylate transporter substrate binding protein [Verticiella sediminum]
MAAALSALIPGSVALADTTWPNKPIRLLVAGTPGGTADALTRVLAEGLHKELGQPVIVESKPGASGGIAIRELMVNGKDGYTFLVIQSGAVSEMPLAYKVDYQPFDDMKPLVKLSHTGLVLVANKDLNLNTLQDVVKYGQEQKDGVNFASYATGLRGHTSGILLGQLTHMEMHYIGYKGSPQALVDLVGGRFPLMFDGITTSLPLIKSGKITPIAVSYPTRIGELPDVPTFKELGYPQLSKAGWFAVWTQPDVPADIQQKVRDATLAYLKQPASVSRIKALGMEPGDEMTSDQLTADLHEAYQEQEALLKSIDYKAE